MPRRPGGSKGGVSTRNVAVVEDAQGKGGARSTWNPGSIRDLNQKSLALSAALKGALLLVLASIAPAPGLGLRLGPPRVDGLQPAPSKNAKSSKSLAYLANELLPSFQARLGVPGVTCCSWSCTASQNGPPTSSARVCGLGPQSIFGLANLGVMR